MIKMNEPIRILISGINGHMGAEVAALALKNYAGTMLAAGVDLGEKCAYEVPFSGNFDDADALAGQVDCIVDFSNHAATHKLLDFAVRHHLPLVLATTGQTDEEKQAILAASKKIPLFFAANYSMGIAILIELAKTTARLMPDAEIEIVEKHHDRKIDAPSGTALAIAEAIRTVRTDAAFHCGRSGYGKRTPEEIGISSIRMGNIVGEHEVLIGTANQTITLKHEAYSRALFAEGALRAAEFLVRQAPGLYDMKSLIG